MSERAETVAIKLDQALVVVFGVSTKRLNEQIEGKIDRFFEDFLSQLSDQKVNDLRSQIATSSYGRHRYKPYAFTEQELV